MAGLRQIVDAPVFTPLGFGLLQVAQDRSPSASGDPHWQQGITWRSKCVGGTLGGLTYDECLVVTGAGAGPVPPMPTQTGNVSLTHRGATPFTVITEFDCGPVGVDDALKIAQDALAQVESWQVERAFWTGVAANQPVVWPHLAAAVAVLDPQGIVLQTAAATGGATPVNASRALGQIEGLLADCYNGVGVIHVPQSAYPVLAGVPGLTQRSGVIYTANGNMIAVGAGYPGTGPSGQTPAAGSAWIYGTGAVALYRSAVHFMNADQSFDRSENTRKMIAYRTYVLGWDCCHAAALMSLGS